MPTLYRLYTDLYRLAPTVRRALHAFSRLSRAPPRRRFYIDRLHRARFSPESHILKRKINIRIQRVQKRFRFPVNRKVGRFRPFFKICGQFDSSAVFFRKFRQTPEIFLYRRKFFHDKSGKSVAFPFKIEEAAGSVVNFLLFSNDIFPLSGIM